MLKPLIFRILYLCNTSSKIIFYFQDLATRSSDSAEFISRYKEAAGSQNSVSLAPMLEILHGIACPDGGSSSVEAATTTKRYLKAKSEGMSRARSGTGTDMNALKEKLLLHVGPRAIHEQGKSSDNLAGFVRPGPFSHNAMVPKYVRTDIVPKKGPPGSTIYNP